MEKYYQHIRTNGYQYVSHSSRRPGLLACLVSGIFVFVLWFRYVTYQLPVPVDRRHDFDGKWIYSRDRNNIMLDDRQCTLAFPGLFEEIERAVGTRREKHIEVEELDAIEPKNGFVRAMIYDQEVRFPLLIQSLIVPYPLAQEYLQGITVLRYSQALHHRHAREHLLPRTCNSSFHPPRHSLLTDSCSQH